MKYKAGQSFSEISVPVRYIAEQTHGLAKRVPSTKGAKTSRGFSVFRNIIIYHESRLESRVSTKLQTLHGVREIHCQYPVLRYTGKDGKRHKHTCDFYVIYEDGWRTAVVVKQEKKREIVEDMIKRIETEGFADHADAIVLMTEKTASYAQFDNDKSILWSRNHHVEEDVSELRALVEGLPGEIMFGELLRGAANLGKRRAAIWRLIDAGVLLPEQDRRIDELTWLASASFVKSHQNLN